MTGESRKRPIGKKVLRFCNWRVNYNRREWWGRGGRGHHWDLYRWQQGKTQWSVSSQKKTRKGGQPKGGRGKKKTLDRERKEQKGGNADRDMVVGRGHSGNVSNAA